MRTRFAPSPTGPLHLGHAYSALLAHDMARAANGQFELRIEDIDQSRARPEWETQIYDDLSWLGLTWNTPVLRQSERLNLYQNALQSLWDRGLLYACSCNRRDISDALSAPQEGVAPAFGPDGAIYPGTCRGKGLAQGGGVLRLDMRAAIQELDAEISFAEKDLSGTRNVTYQVSSLPDTVGDIVLSRKNMGTSYHLSVVLDDAAQQITDVIRGQDLFDATQIHVVLQHLLGLPTPKYHHHRLIRDAHGKRLAKRDDARAIAKFRDDGATPGDIRQMVGLI